MPDMTSLPGLSPFEATKVASRGLRGEIAADLVSPASEVSEATYGLLKFHGAYEQHDRDTATQRKQAGLEKEYSFMARVRIPAGRLTAAQYLTLDGLADEVGNGTLRITTRQAIQFHSVQKGNLIPLVAAIDRAKLTTLGACGDVVRNVAASPAPIRDAIHARLEHEAHRLSAALLPRTGAHREIFVDGEPLEPAPAEAEPLYGQTYLPRKFKIGLAHPDDNTIDVLTNDCGLIGMWEGQELRGWIVCLGGGLGMTHNRADTYPRLATPVALVGPDHALEAAEAAVRLHRDFGGRADRKRARLKYVLDDIGLEAARAAFLDRLTVAAWPAPALPKLRVPDPMGWHAQGDGDMWLGLPVPSGRIADHTGVELRTALREVVDRFGSDPVLCSTQDILLTNIDPGNRDAIERLLRSRGVAFAADRPPVERWAMACPALPTCGLALAEAERISPAMMGAIHAALVRHGLGDERLSVRITGCPNGCTRPYAGDIGVVGRTPGHYALFVGGDFEGTRLNWKVRERLPEADVARALEPLFGAFAGSRNVGEGFGDFCNRIGPAQADAILTEAGIGDIQTRRPA